MDETDNCYDLKNFGQYQPIMSLDKNNFKEMQLFFLLKILADNPEGITAYQLGTNYHYPRSKAMRALDELEDEAGVIVKEKIIDGRTNKIYKLTSTGFTKLMELKERWHERFLMMEELTTASITSSERKFYQNKIIQCSSKIERIEFLEHMKEKIEGKAEQIEKRLNTMNQLKSQVVELLEKVKRSDLLDKEDVVQLFKITN